MTDLDISTQKLKKLNLSASSTEDAPMDNDDKSTSLLMEDATKASEMQTDEDKLKLLPKWVEMLKNRNTELEAAVEIRKLSSMNPSPIQEIVDAGVVPTFVKFLTLDHDSKLQFEAAWILSNIAAGTTSHVQQIVDCGAIPLFIKLLGSKDANVCDQVVWAIGNIAVDCVKYRDLLLTSGVMNPLLYVGTSDTDLSSLKNIVWAIHYLCAKKPPPPFSLVSPAIPRLAHLIEHTDNEILEQVCWTLCNISSQCGYIINEHFVPRLIAILKSSSNISILTATVKTLFNAIIGASDLKQHYLVTQGIVPVFCTLLSHSERPIVFRALKGIALLAKGVPYVQDLVRDCGGLARLKVLAYRPIHDEARQILAQNF